MGFSGGPRARCFFRHILSLQVLYIAKNRSLAFPVISVWFSKLDLPWVSKSFPKCTSLMETGYLGTRLLIQIPDLRKQTKTPVP